MENMKHTTSIRDLHNGYQILESSERYKKWLKQYPAFKMKQNKYIKRKQIKRLKIIAEKTLLWKFIVPNIYWIILKM